MTQARVAAPLDRIGPVYDDGRIAPGLDEHSDAPLKHWREHLRRKRQRERQKTEPPVSPAVLEDDKYPGSIDEYA
ncbi:MAG: hypothetical protein B7Y41_01010 [Hydrogenophilales bacterium 28-61-23]|nr:MAG: hypothetical protein B7Y41_01010 [Hydrogenophilales bacterium 28-61-23]